MHWGHNEDEVDSFPHPNTCTRQLAISLGLFPFEVPSLHFRVLFFAVLAAVPQTFSSPIHPLCGN